LLLAFGRFLDLQPDVVEEAEDVQSRLVDRIDQRERERAILAGTVAGHRARLRRVGNQRAFRRLHLRKSAAGASQPGALERIVAAGVEDQDVELRAAAAHLAQHQFRADHLEIEILPTGRVGIDRHQEIGAVHLQSVPGIIEQRDIRVRDGTAELGDRMVEADLVQVEQGIAADHGEPGRLQAAGHQPGVVARVGQPPDRGIGAVADHQRDSRAARREARLLRVRRCPDRHGKPQQRHQPNRMPAAPVPSRHRQGPCRDAGHIDVLMLLWRLAGPMPHKIGRQPESLGGWTISPAAKVDPIMAGAPPSSLLLTFGCHAARAAGSRGGTARPPHRPEQIPTNPARQR
jgi:hypothetical protein